MSGIAKGPPGPQVIEGRTAALVPLLGCSGA
jgi:hypothetical protein